MCRTVSALIVFAACGHDRTPTPSVDATVDVDPPAHFVASYVLGPTISDQVTTTIPLSVGDVLVVGVASDNETSVHDIWAGPRELGAWMDNQVGSCSHRSETWVTTGPPLEDGPVELAITMSKVTTVTAYVVQFSGTEHPQLVMAGFSNTREPGVAGGPAVETTSGHVVVSTVTTCDPLGPIQAPFTSLGGAAGWADMAYFIPSDDGAYGARWSYAGTDYWEANTIVFHR